MSRKLAVNPVPCTGCLCCEAVCSLRRTGSQDREASAIRVNLDVFGGRNVLLYCRQCDDAPCAAACPAEAINRDEDSGAWVLDPGKCQGCGLCVDACPFGAMRFRAGVGIPSKCDLCGGNPACASACSFGAVRFLDPGDPGFGGTGMPSSEQSPDPGKGAAR